MTAESRQCHFVKDSTSRWKRDHSDAEGLLYRPARCHEINLPQAYLFLFIYFSFFNYLKHGHIIFFDLKKNIKANKVELF
jgi:hypothetical protein